jgi:hypothetical protein
MSIVTPVPLGASRVVPVMGSTIATPVMGSTMVSPMMGSAVVPAVSPIIGGTTIHPGMMTSGMPIGATIHPGMMASGMPIGTTMMPGIETTMNPAFVNNTDMGSTVPVPSQFMSGTPPVVTANLTVPGGTPAAINQMVGTRRIPIIKSQYFTKNWFSCLDAVGFQT